MTEKILLSLCLLLCAALGWFIREMLSDIKGTQKEHGSALGNIRTHLLKVEDKQLILEGEVVRMREEVRSVSGIQRETKSALDHNLYEMRQQLKEQADAQYEQKQNFGKIIVIVQKLYAATRNGSGKP